MITIYHRAMIRSIRILWLLEELGLPCSVVEVRRGDGKLPKFRRVNPMGRFPIIKDGDVVVFESGAILEYLLESYDKDHRFSPHRGSPAWRDYIQWMHGSETFMWPAMQWGHHSMVRPPEDRFPLLVEEGRDEYLGALEALGQWLGGRRYLCGDQFTAADIMLGWGLFVNEAAGLSGDCKNVEDYMDRLRERPAYQTIKI